MKENRLNKVRFIVPDLPALTEIESKEVLFCIFSSKHSNCFYSRKKAIEMLTITSTSLISKYIYIYIYI